MSGDADKLEVMAQRMTDEELQACADAIRGNTKRDRRRMLTNAESLALVAVMAEQARRVKA